MLVLALRLQLLLQVEPDKMISPTNPVSVIVALLLALATAKVLIRQFGAPDTQGRFATIDGLRGYLALLVFLHHSCIWYFYLRTSAFESPPSNFFANIGRAGVALFFMITGFLFATKIIDAKTKGMDWIRLYVSRFLRLAPLYAFAMALLFISVAAVSGFALIDSPVTLAINALKWIGFTVLGEPDLNGVESTKLILAGVPWTLAYEWAFYLCLPLLSILIGAIPPFPILAIGFAGTLCFIKIHALPIFVAPFFSGILVALLVRRIWFRQIAERRISSLIAIAVVFSALILFPTTYSRIPLVLLSVGFALIAGGATLFGTLTNPLSRMLGEMAYSIYLLHGLVLFTLFHFIIGNYNARLLSPVEYWTSISLTTPVLILISFTTFNCIEKPAMQYTERVASWIRQAITIRQGASEKSF
ncbi:acyltransferase family protein [Paraburkholderia lycopersici]|uniref:Peptidoglycan/LPS O-acetylase OafA/YrhL, contains acyltransferase and SGNH-hydrolase domains n=1 Tax=Paraburkholderia lycopersici TaxID=416944 RepID=A0A1G6K2L4_9BURK|nr:acyltransferase [Paraburkholderia lycopersici]SDC25240.1 Peptidoglycan/LPS O-acetylase OafA/YrhL, contains acyltransferase and SGNH-hydrolase domains [Paraburkholderia lycopersici]